MVPAAACRNEIELDGEVGGSTKAGQCRLRRSARPQHLDAASGGDVHTSAGQACPGGDLARLGGRDVQQENFAGAGGNRAPGLRRDAPMRAMRREAQGPLVAKSRVFATR